MSAPMDDRDNPTVPVAKAKRTSSVKEITKFDMSDSSLPTRALRSLMEARRRAEREGTDEGVLRVYVHLLEQICPDIDFAVQVCGSAIDRATVVQYATSRILDDQQESILLSQAALVFSSTPRSTVCSQSVAVTDTYTPRLEPSEIAARVGIDVPLRRPNVLIGALSAEAGSASLLTTNLRTTLLLVADHIVTSLEAAALRRETEHLRDYVEKLLQHANVPVIIAGRDRSIRVVSEAFLRITGIDRVNAVGSDFVSLAPKTDRVRLLAAFVSATRGRSVSPIELQITRASGGHARLSFRLASILDGDGNVAGIIAIGRDLTAVRELEGQVLHADKLATIGQLATGIVHEINNPLTSIGVYSEYLLKHLEEAKADKSDIERAQKIVDGANRISEFTKNLVMYARPSLEKPENVQLRDSLEKSIAFCEHLIEDAHVTITRLYADHLPEVSAVAGRLHQVFVNLITNACHAAAPENARIEIGAQYSGDGNVCIWIRDNGQGIPTTQQDRIFDPFFSTKRIGKGTGLGLSIVRTIVEQHGGTIALDSEEGVGTKFTLTFPSIHS